MATLSLIDPDDDGRMMGLSISSSSVTGKSAQLVARQIIFACED